MACKLGDQVATQLTLEAYLLHEISIKSNFATGIHCEMVMLMKPNKYLFQHDIKQNIFRIHLEIEMLFLTFFLKCYQ